MITVRQNQAASQALMDIQILDGEDGLETMIDYAASRYDEESIVKFKDIFMKITQLLLHHTTQDDITVQDIKKQVNSNNSIFKLVTGIFSRKGQIMAKEKIKDEDSELAQNFNFFSLIKFVFPSIFAFVFIALYQMVDGFFIQEFVGDLAIA